METLQRTANRGSISTGYDIDNSLKFERSSNEAVETTNQAGGNRKTWTFSAWIKRTALSEDYHTIFGAEYTNIQIMANDRPRLVLYNGTSYYADPEMLMRDTSAWYHIVVQLDTTQSTASDRVKWWINGDRVTVFNNSTYTSMTQNTDFSGVGQPSGYGSGGYLRLGRFFSGDEGFDGYMADVYYLNGTAAEADDFGEYDEDSGIWIPKEYTGSGYGTQGFHYKFDNSANLGEDSSGEGHDANSFSNITAADQSSDSPTNNFATYNALLPYADVREGATRFFNHDAGADMNLSTVAVANGKWYAEFKTPSNIAGGNGQYGVHANEGSITDGKFIGQDAWSCGPMGGSNYYRIGNVNSSAYFDSTWGQNDIMSVALDMDNKKVYFAKNGTWGNSGNPATDTNGIALPSAYEDYEWFIGASLVLNTDTFNANYGGYTTISISSAESDANGYGTFEYAPPSGYYALCTKNLAEFG